jgi:hypothetical protein
MIPGQNNIILDYVVHYLLVSLFVVMNRGGVILWDLILAIFLTTFQLVCGSYAFLN